MFCKPILVALLGAAITFVGSAGADVILSTDFAGRTVSERTVSDISWSMLGVSDPGPLTVNEPIPGIFDTAAAQGHFAPDRNVGNEGPWSVDVPLVLADGVGSVTLESVELDWQHFNNLGALQGPARSVDWTVTVSGSVSGLLAGSAVSALNINGVSGSEVLSFASPLVLTSAESWTVTIRAEGSNPTGNNTGLDGFTINGVVGESSGSDFAIVGVRLVADELTLIWVSRGGGSYIVKASADMRNWEVELGSDIPADAGSRTTRSFDLEAAGLAGDGRLFFRVERQ